VRCNRYSSSEVTTLAKSPDSRLGLENRYIHICTSDSRKGIYICVCQYIMLPVDMSPDNGFFKWGRCSPIPAFTTHSLMVATPNESATERAREGVGGRFVCIHCNVYIKSRYPYYFVSINVALIESV